MRIKKYILKGVLLSIIYLAAVTVYSEENKLDWRLTSDGLGPIKIGMTLDEAEKASHKKFSLRDPQSGMPEDESCFYTNLNDIDSVSFMISYNKIVRININSGHIMTDLGAHIGLTEEELQIIYQDKLSKEKHKYIEKGHYLTLHFPKEERAIRFETDGKKVMRIYAGQEKEVEYTEDCL